MGGYVSPPIVMTERATLPVTSEELLDQFSFSWFFFYVRRLLVVDQGRRVLPPRPLHCPDQPPALPLLPSALQHCFLLDAETVTFSGGM